VTVNILPQHNPHYKPLKVSRLYATCSIRWNRTRKKATGRGIRRATGTEK